MWASPFVGVGTCLRRGLLSWVESAPFLLSAAALSSAPLSQVLRQSHLQGGLYVVAWSCKPDKSLLQSAGRRRVHRTRKETPIPFVLCSVLQSWLPTLFTLLPSRPVARCLTCLWMPLSKDNLHFSWNSSKVVNLSGLFSFLLLIAPECSHKLNGCSEINFFTFWKHYYFSVLFFISVWTFPPSLVFHVRCFLCLVVLECLFLRQNGAPQIRRYGLVFLPLFFTFKNNLKILLFGSCSLCPRRYMPF